MPSGLDMLRRAGLILAIVSALLLAACQGEPGEIATAGGNAAATVASVRTADDASAPKRSSKRHYALGIVGYNYTEVGIDDYSVNGTGAFNLGVSTEHSGGGKTACCFGWVPAMKLPAPIRIEWTRGEDRWCRKTALLTGPAPLEPTTLEVHIFPDRHIEVSITDQYSPPRVNMGGRAGRDFRVGEDVRAEMAQAMVLDSQHAECRDGRFPLGVLAEQEDREKREREKK